MKKLLVLLSLSVFSFFLTAQLACAMKRSENECNDAKKTIVTIQPDQELEKQKLGYILSSIPEGIWTDIFTYACTNDKIYRALASVSINWNRLSTNVMLKNLSFHEKLPNEVILQHATMIRSLDLSKNIVITDDALAQLANITALKLEGNTIITNDGIKNLTTFISLNIRNMNARKQYKGDAPYITDEGIALLTTLEILDMDNSGITPNGILHFTKLTKLRAWGSEISVDVVKNFPYLTDLDLGCADNDGEATQRGIGELTNLTRLTLNNHTTDDELKKLTNLTKLDLEDNTYITGNALKGLKNLTSLKALPGYGGDGLIEVTINDHEIKNLTKLKKLRLGSDDVTDDGIKYLTNLVLLEMFLPQITDDGLKGLQPLTYLQPHANSNITDKSINCLTNLTFLVFFPPACCADIPITWNGVKNLPRLRLNAQDKERLAKNAIKGYQDRINTSIKAGNEAVDAGSKLKNYSKAMKHLSILFKEFQGKTLFPIGFDHSHFISLGTPIKSQLQTLHNDIFWGGTASALSPSNLNTR